jgi:hypothetical protein
MTRENSNEIHKQNIQTAWKVTARGQREVAGLRANK